MPPSEDGGPVKGDFTAVFVEEHLAPYLEQDGHQEKVVYEAREPVG